MIEALCPACAAGPAKIDGHSDLRVQTIGNALFSFRCQRCNTLWKRTGNDGQYTWQNITEEPVAAGVGMVLPTRPEARDSPTPTLAKFQLPPKR
jgi:hypothetical protein